MGYVPLKKIFPFTLTKKEEKFERKNPYLLATLSPLSPSPYQGEGEELEREASLLFNSPELEIIKGVSKRS